MTTPTTRLAEIAERHGKATKGEWRSYSEHLSGGKYWCVTAPDLEEYIVDGIHEEYNGEADSAFIAHAHQDIPYLLARDAVAQARSREDAEMIEKMVVDAFDLGFSWAQGLQGQNLEDSRAVGRTLQSYLFSEAGLTVDTDEWDSFTTADIAICEGKRRIKAALVTKLRARADEMEDRTDG